MLLLIELPLVLHLVQLMLLFPLLLMLLLQAELLLRLHPRPVPATNARLIMHDTTMLLNVSPQL